MFLNLKPEKLGNIKRVFVVGLCGFLVSFDTFLCVCIYVLMDFCVFVFMCVYVYFCSFTLKDCPKENDVRDILQVIILIIKGVMIRMLANVFLPSSLRSQQHQKYCFESDFGETKLRKLRHLSMGKLKLTS